MDSSMRWPVRTLRGDDRIVAFDDNLAEAASRAAADRDLPGFSI